MAKEQGRKVVEGGDEDVELYGSAFIDRPQLEFELQQSIWAAVVGLLFGALLWRLLAHGLAGPFGRRRALVVAAAAAVPGLILPAVVVGTPPGSPPDSWSPPPSPSSSACRWHAFTRSRSGCRPGWPSPWWRQG